MKINEKLLYKLLNILILIPLLIIIIKIIDNAFNIVGISSLFNCYNEVRDFPTLRLTEFIINGINPYKISFLNELNVPFFNLYPGLLSLITAIICKCTGINVISGHYIVNLTLLLLTCYNIWLITKNCFYNYKIIALICIFLNAATFFTMFGVPIYTFRGDAIGIYVISLIYLIVFKNKKHTFLLAVLSILLIFTKQFLIVTALPLFIYYLISDKKLAFKYLFKLIVLGIITFITIQILFPLHWAESIYRMYLCNSDYGTFSEAVHNISDFYKIYRYYLILILVGIICAIRYNFILKFNQKTEYNIFKFFQNIKNNNEYIIFLILNLFFGTLVLLYVAKCGGDAPKYCRDLLSVPLFIFTILIWHKIFQKYILINNRNIEIKKFILILGIFFVTLFTYNQFPKFEFTYENIKDIIELDSFLEKYKNEKIYLGCETTGYLIKNKIYDVPNIWYNNCHIGGFNPNESRWELINKLMFNRELSNLTNQHNNTIKEMVKNKEFKIMVCSDEDWEFFELKNNYYPKESFQYNIPNSNLAITVYHPKE